MSSSNFWQRKVQELSPAPPPSPVKPDEPRWRIVPQQQENKPLVPLTADEHDFSKARSNRQKSACPECDSGNYMKVTPASAARCFECGYVDGRFIADPGRPLAST